MLSDRQSHAATCWLATFASSCKSSASVDNVVVDVCLHAPGDFVRFLVGAFVVLPNNS